MSKKIKMSKIAITFKKIVIGIEKHYSTPFIPISVDCGLEFHQMLFQLSTTNLCRYSRV